MNKLVRYSAQAVFYALFFVPLAYVSHQPNYRYMEDDIAVLKVAVRHAGEIIGECKSIVGESHGMRPSSMVQAVEVCPRERSPLELELILDGETLYRAQVAPSGLHNDGISSMYQRFELPAGPHHLQIRMNDDIKVDGFNWQFEQDINLQPAQVMVASFKEGFRIQ
ncbi:MAG: hypothetical protein IMF06_01790 [Proteobacteria bacterium]|nr:hypothetical protein [Pseudomonadota bacterium]